MRSTVIEIINFKINKLPLLYISKLRQYRLYPQYH